MVRGGRADTIVGSAVVVREKYFWPDLQLNIWTIVMLATASTILGVNANFLQIQQRMDLGIPWIFPYSISVGAIAIIFVGIEIVSIMQRQLLPSRMLLLSFILLVLFIAGLIGCALQLFSGPNINGLCNEYVFDAATMGANPDTLAYLEQKTICQSWQAAFSFWLIGIVFLVWMMVIASQVNSNIYATASR